jgi:putative ABC transport system permease protein
MTKFFRLFYRNLIRNKTFSIIAIAGFTLSLTIVLLLSAFVSYESSYDSFHTNIDQLYRLIRESGGSGLNEDNINFLQTDYPEIESVCRYNNSGATITWNQQTSKFPILLQTEESFFSMFEVEFLQGNPSLALASKDNILISDKLSAQLFETGNSIGETIIINHNMPFKVTAIYKSMPNNSSFQPDAIIHRDTKEMVESINNNGRVTFYNRFVLKLNPNSDPNFLETKLSNDLRAHDLETGDVRLVSFKNSYMNMSATGNSHLKHTNLFLIVILAGIALIIVVVSGLNYIILFTANNLTRLKEIALKKTVGANSDQIFRQFLMESVFLCIISFFLAVIAAQLIHPTFENIVGNSFPMSSIMTFPTLLYIIAGVLLVAIVSGWLPSIVVSQFSPSSLFHSGKSRSLKIKSGLLTVQYAVTITLIIALIVISRQIGFVKNKDLGFDSDQLIRLDVHSRLADKLPILKRELIKHPQIIDATASVGGPGQVIAGTSWQDARDAGWTDVIPCILSDTDFFSVFNAPIIAGRTFNANEQENVVVINETALKLVGWTSLEGRKINGNTVIGVVRDIHVKDMHRTIGPTFFINKPDLEYSWLSVRVSPDDIPGTIQYIEKTWKEICPKFAFNYHFYDEWIGAMYKTEEQLAFAIRLFVIFAILIACLGTFGVVQFTTNRRTKEIGIRKVNGASSGEIIRLLNMDFLKWVGIAFCCAAPLSYLIMRLWLQNFAYRTALSWWIFILAGLIAFMIAILTISWQTWRAARRNPIEALRYE